MQTQEFRVKRTESIADKAEMAAVLKELLIVDPSAVPSITAYLNRRLAVALKKKNRAT